MILVDSGGALTFPFRIHWLTGEPGMPLMIEEVVEDLAKLRQIGGDATTQGIGDNFLRLIEDDALPMSLATSLLI
jgi:hypothetical protein